MKKPTTPVRYIGRRDTFTDRLYDSGLSFVKGQVREVPNETARSLLRHVDLFEQVTAQDIEPVPQAAEVANASAKKGSQKLDDTEQLMKAAAAKKAEKIDEVTNVSDLHDQVARMTTKDTLEKFAKDHFNVDLDKRQKVDELKAEVHTLIDRFGV